MPATSEIIGFVSPDFDGVVDGAGNIISEGTQGFAIMLPAEFVVHAKGGTEPRLLQITTGAEPAMPGVELSPYDIPLHEN